MKELIFEQLRVYKQAINQSITQYYDKVIELCKRVDMSMTDSMKLQYLLAGVKQSLGLHIALHDPQSSEAFLSYARNVEDTLSLTGTDYDLNQYENHPNMNHDYLSTTLTTHSRQDIGDKRPTVQQSQQQQQTSTSSHINNFRNDNVSYSGSSKTAMPKRKQRHVI